LRLFRHTEKKAAVMSGGVEDRGFAGPMRLLYRRHCAPGSPGASVRYGEGHGDGTMPALVPLTKKLPASVRWLCGDPPVLSSEKRKDYEALFSGMADSVKPTDSVEWIWLRDIVDHTWEIRRLRRFKCLLIEVGIVHQHPTQHPFPRHNAKPERKVSDLEVARRIAFILDRGARLVQLENNKKEEEASEKPKRARKPKKRPSEADAVQAFRQCINDYQTIDRLLSSAEDRRNAVLREIDRRRDGLGQRLRQSSDDVIDAEFSETAVAAE
jgi:hypothetical protein